MSKVKIKNPVGQPRKYKSAKDLEKRMNEYFEYCNREGVHYGVVGMCVHLDIVRTTLLEYEKEPEYMDTIKKAKQRIESYNEQMLYKMKNPTGAIFNLKNNFGWTDKLETKQEIKATVTLEQLLSDKDIEL
ncbi:MAG: hypothetical protein GX675_01305 [Erysipelotrichaceae bacterium]|nr:hypothetical protein [Erysipelotrichaceae bacterium]